MSKLNGKLALIINELKNIRHMEIDSKRLVLLNMLFNLFFRLSFVEVLFLFTKKTIIENFLNANNKMSENGTNKNSVSFCARFINLSNRIDRLVHINNELKRIEFIQFERFEARYNKNGALGCAQSHHAIISEWNTTQSQLLFIIEDDAVFNISEMELQSIINDFYLDRRLDVLLLGFNTKKSISFNESFNLVINSQTTSGYILKSYMKDHFIKNIEKSIKLLELGVSSSFSAIDIVWKELQRKHVFVTPKSHAISQIESFSDIEGKIVKYNV